jgi:hypothetical protein
MVPEEASVGAAPPPPVAAADAPPAAAEANPAQPYDGQQPPVVQPPVVQQPVAPPPAAQPPITQQPTTPQEPAAQPPAGQAAPVTGTPAKRTLRGSFAKKLGSPPTPPADPANSEKAAVGVGAKGRDYGGAGFVTTPIATLFTVEQRIAFDVQIPNAMKIYKAAHDNKGPKTQEEFMDVIIKENAVQLPDLPAGDVYWYDVKAEELMVRHPTDQ